MRSFLPLFLALLLCSTTAFADDAKKADNAKKAAPAKAAPAKAAPAKAAPAKAAPAKAAPAAKKLDPESTAKTAANPAKVAPASKPASKPAKMAAVVEIPKEAKFPEPPAGTHLETIVKTGYARVCVRSDIPPFGYFRGTQLVGFDVALAKELVAAVGIRYGKNLQIRWTVINAAQRIPSLKQERCDFVVASFSKTAEREKVISFSKVYVHTQKVILVRADKISESPTVAVVSGATTQKENLGTVYQFFDYDHILDIMKTSSVDYVVTDHPTGLFLVRQSSYRYAVHKVLKQEENYAIGVNKKHTYLLGELNRVLDALSKNGRLGHLKRMYIR